MVGLMLAHIPMFLSDSFKVDKLLENSVMLLYSRMVYPTTNNSKRGKAAAAFPLASVTENPLEALFNEQIKFQSFVSQCLLVSQEGEEETQKEAFSFLSSLFSDPSMKRWLTAPSSSSSSSSSSGSLHLSKQQGFGTKLQKIVVKLLQLLIVLLSTRSSPPTKTSKPIDVSVYRALLDFYSKLFSTLPLQITNAHRLKNFKYDLSEAESHMAIIFQQIFLLCFSCSEGVTASYSEADPSKQKRYHGKSSSTESSNNPSDYAGIVHLCQQYYPMLSAFANESINWLTSFMKSNSNNNYCYHLLLLDTALKDYCILSNHNFPVLLQKMIQGFPPSHWISQVIVPGSMFISSSSSPSSSSPAPSTVHNYNAIQFFDLFAVISTVAITVKKMKYSNHFRHITLFLTRNFTNIYLQKDSYHLNKRLEYFYCNDNLEEKEFFLSTVQFILQYESDTQELIISSPHPAGISSPPPSLNPSASRLNITLTSFIRMLLKEFCVSDNHSIRGLACEILGDLRPLHWKLIREVDRSTNNSFLQAQICQIMIQSTEHAIGTVRTIAFRAFGEIISTYPEFVSESAQSRVQFPKELLNIFIRGCKDTKLSVRIQSTYAMNKYLVSFPDLIQEIIAENPASIGELYLLSLALLSDSEKLSTTALLGVGYVVHFMCTNESPGGPAHSKSEGETRQRVIELLRGTVLPKFGIDLQQAANHSAVYNQSISLQQLLQKSSKKFVCANTQTLSYLVHHLLLRETSPEIFLPIISISFNIFHHFFVYGFLQLQILSLSALSLWITRVALLHFVSPSEEHWLK